MSITWTTRAETGADPAAIDAVNFHAFGRRYEPDLVIRLRADATAWLPALSYVATQDTPGAFSGVGLAAGGPDDEVVAHALLSRCHIDDTPALVLGPVAVLPAYQRAGAGSATIRAALGAARSAGEHAVVLLGHPEYYPRFGFRESTAFGIHGEHDGPAQMALALNPDRPLPRGTIHYPSAWDA
ncbi:N-acetyltransferase [Kribbella lupini]|uniref:N-acetyltransferase n=1 Tax=Kribbella lupini TaxID=291602 RepID=A0ABP4L9P7_9ACTN